ncbi:neprilysin-4 [Drosophila mojavensis]|uniref:Uncharacterized protein n=1 Tax=Drosophila mojavensis TaxID=7230 RepID=B4KBE4_DROMO|nr:neprilysin-4 [Drosophila mojavensis]EDW16872.1 uncharacterized protein Dmoj_GI10778 [Drosophila mojavensis]
MRTTRFAQIFALCLLQLARTASGAGPTYRYNNINTNRGGAAAAAAMHIHGHGHSNSHSNSNNIVDSRQEQRIRQSMSRDMLKYMNLSSDPCADFYEYACGNWGRYHTRQLREGELITAQHLMEARIVEQLQQLLTLPLSANDLSPVSAANVRKVRSFYDSCVAVEANAAERRQFLMKVLREHGGLRNVANSHWKHDYHWLQMLASLRRNYGLDILIGFDIDLNLQQMSGNSVYLGEPRLTIIPAEHCNALATRQANVRDEVYEQIQQQVADNMRDWFEMESGEAARFGGDIIRFEFELCKRMREQETLPPVEASSPEVPPVYSGRSRVGQERLRQQQPGGSPQYPRMKLVELTTKMGTWLDFKLFVESIVETGYPDYVYLRSPSYLAHLARTAKSNNQVTISSYILYRALFELNQPPEEQAMMRPRQCVRVMQRLFPQVLGDMYQRHVQRDDVQHDMEDVFSDLVKAFDQQLRVEWLDDSDRRTARTRLSQYHTQFPDYQGVDLSGLHFQKNEDYWHKLETTLRYNSREYLNQLRGNDFGQLTENSLNAFEVRAAVEPRQQAVLVGWGLMQAPYYSHYYPKALRYALLGQRLAAALLQAFDDEGWNRHPQATAPWNELTMSGYRNVTECQRAQYSNYLSDQPSEFRNATRLREIIAETGALNVAFNAYLSWLEQIDSKMIPLLIRETLPELNFTNTQLFFIYFAQLRCWAKQNEEPPSEAMPLLQHTPQRWDVNGPLSNSEEFGKEFNCPLGTNMNSGNKCLIF